MLHLATSRLCAAVGSVCQLRTEIGGWHSVRIAAAECSLGRRCSPKFLRPDFRRRRFLVIDEIVLYSNCKREPNVNLVKSSLKQPYKYWSSIHPLSDRSTQRIIPLNRRRCWVKRSLLETPSIIIFSGHFVVSIIVVIFVASVIVFLVFAVVVRIIRVVLRSSFFKLFLTLIQSSFCLSSRDKECVGSIRRIVCKSIHQ